MIIGKEVTFIRSRLANDREGFKAQEFKGIVLDKIQSWEFIEGKRYRADCYLVLLPNGVIGKFFCDEAVRLDKQSSAQLSLT